MTDEATTSKWVRSFHVSVTDGVTCEIKVPPGTDEATKLERLRFVRDLLTGAIDDMTVEQLKSTDRTGEPMLPLDPCPHGCVVNDGVLVQRARGCTLEHGN